MWVKCLVLPLWGLTGTVRQRPKFVFISGLMHLFIIGKTYQVSWLDFDLLLISFLIGF